MELKDYINYYIGCPCIFYMADDDPAGYHMTLDCDTVKDWLANQDETDIKLVLRRLEDMTEEEREQVWQIIIGRPFPDTGDVKWFVESNQSANRWVMMSGVERVGIEMTGYLWADSDLCHVKFNPNLVMHYLLRQGFDLFGLIPAGPAIDAKTVKQ